MQSGWLSWASLIFYLDVLNDEKRIRFFANLDYYYYLCKQNSSYHGSNIQ